ncbi:MAG: hypothetical protein RL693_2769 [Verrucomicrobiota bacterium]|jgi:hypothetical protein
MKKLTALLASLLFSTSGMFAEAPFPPPQHLGEVSTYGRNIQRTMRLLATSTPEHRNTVRILFYGQSITEQNWSKLVIEDLRSRFPNANLIIENRALGGFASQMLVKAAETDLYPFQPDLLILHVYGAHDKYGDIIRRVREQTTAEILQQNDHVTKSTDFTEETDASKLSPKGEIWSSFMNHLWLPSLAKKYGTELCDQRALWKLYLTDNNLEPKALLKDDVHLNPHGEYVMAQFVKAYLRYDPALGASPAESWVKNLEVGKEASWKDGKLRLEFEGNRVDAILKSNPAAPLQVRIDGHKPSEIPELYGFTRALANPGGKWPVIAPVKSERPLVLEDWTMEVKRDAANEKLFTFTLSGSKTGPDGEGRSDQRFVSKSGRIVIEPDDWNVAYAMRLAGIKTVPDTFVVHWSVSPYFVDELLPEKAGMPQSGVEQAVTLFQGLKNGKHTLEIMGDSSSAIAALRVYAPPLQ